MTNLTYIANSTEAAKKVFSKLGERQRYRHRTDLKRLFFQLTKENPALSQKDFIKVFKRLEEAGVGSLIIGRGDKPNRFAWRYNLKDVAKAATQDLELQPLPPPAKTVRSTAVVKPVMRDLGSISISLSVPANLAPELLAHIKAFTER